MMKQFIQGLAFGAAIFASGCVSLFPESAPPKPRYHIAAIEPGGITGERVAWALAVDDPRTSRVYDTVKVAVSPKPGKIEYFANAEWADRAPKLFQTALVQSFEDSGRILNVGNRGSILLPEFVLQMDIRKLQMDVRGGDEVPAIRIYARLTDGRGKIYAAKLFAAEQQAAGKSGDDVIAAFHSAFDAIIVEMIAWTFDQGNAVSDQGPAS